MDAAFATAAEAVLAIERLLLHGPEQTVAGERCEEARAPNVVPSRTVVRGTLRTLEPETAHERQNELAQTVVDVAQSRGADASVSWGPDCPELTCDPGLTAMVRDAARSCRGATVTPGVPTTGCDDFARFLELAPGCYFRVGAAR